MLLADFGCSAFNQVDDDNQSGDIYVQIRKVPKNVMSGFIDCFT